MPAHISIFTGLSPFEHKIFLNGQFYKIDKGYLPFLFKERGYKNWAFLSSSILDRVFGLSKGFDFYEDNINNERRCEDTLNIFKEKLKDLKEPFFLWIHFFDPHTPYTPPEVYRKKFLNPYDGEIAYMDFCISELFKILPENTIILIIGDHGELLGEHGEAEHGVLLYEGGIKVPCILVNPEIKNKKISKPVSFNDIYKIIISYFFENKNLSDIINKLEEKPIISSSLYGKEVFGFEPSKSVIFNNFKLILYSEKNFKLFNLKKDPKEEKDMSKENLEKTRELIKILKNYKFPETLSSFASESEKILKSLGYLMPSKREDLKDPERGVLIEKKVKEAIEKISYNDFKSAEKILKSVLQEFPAHGEALSALGKLYLSLGENEKGLEVFQKLISLRKYDVITNLRYAQALIANKKFDEGEKILENSLSINPRLKEVYGELTKIYSLRNEKEKILNLQKKAEENGIEDFYLLFEMGKILESEKKYEESFIYYHKSYKLDPVNLEVLLALSRALIKKRNPKLSIFYLKQFLRIYPDNIQANYLYGILLYNLESKKDEAKIYLNKALNLCNSIELCNKIKGMILKIENNEKINLEEALL